MRAMRILSAKLRLRSLVGRRRSRWTRQSRCSMVKTLRVVVFALVLIDSAGAAEKIRFGFPDLAARFIPLPLGEKKDFLKEQGLQGEFIRIRPAISSAALVSGEIDFDMVLGNGIAAAIRGLPVKVVACYLPATPIALIVRPEFKSVQELKGKTIGLNTFGSISSPPQG